MQFNNGNGFKDITAKELVDILLIESFKENVQFYGIEGLEDAIKRVYSQMPDTRDRILETYNRVYKYGK